MKIIFFFIPFFLFSKSLSITSGLDTNNVYIGGIITWEVFAKEGSFENIFFPSIILETDTLTLREQGPLIKNNVTYGIYFKIVAWDTGIFTTPNYQVSILNDDSTTNYNLDIKPLTFTVSSILENTSITDFLPIKGPVPVKKILPLKLIFLIVILSFLLILILFFLTKRKKTIYNKNNYASYQDPKQKAFERLEKINHESLIKDFYAELSHISREYIESKYFIRSLEMTSEEIANHRILFKLNDEDFNCWIKFLNESDKVKYARELVKPSKMKNDKAIIIDLINKT